jgi:hypothetical protein
MSQSARQRPALFRALGRGEPPFTIDVDGMTYERLDVFKHDSWAATALYEDRSGHRIVCKFNRTQSILGLPMRWLGKRLAAREAFALRRLAGLQGIPAPCGVISADGVVLENAAGHDFIEGHPLSKNERVDDDFFPTLFTLLRSVHWHRMAYVDLHKRENIIVGDDGRPYLIDFQVCFGLWFLRSAKNPFLRSILRALQQSDIYHLSKHIRNHSPAQMGLLQSVSEGARPWWIQAHRTVAVPLRQLRRSLLIALGIRSKGGRADTEAFPEDAVRREAKQAA